MPTLSVTKLQEAVDQVKRNVGISTSTMKVAVYLNEILKYDTNDLLKTNIESFTEEVSKNRNAFEGFCKEKMNTYYAKMESSKQEFEEYILLRYYGYYLLSFDLDLNKLLTIDQECAYIKAMYQTLPDQITSFLNLATCLTPLELIQKISLLTPDRSSTLAQIFYLLAKLNLLEKEYEEFISILLFSERSALAYLEEKLLKKNEILKPFYQKNISCQHVLQKALEQDNNSFVLTLGYIQNGLFECITKKEEASQEKIKRILVELFFPKSFPDGESPFCYTKEFLEGIFETSLDSLLKDLKIDFNDYFARIEQEVEKKIENLIHRILCNIKGNEQVDILELIKTEIDKEKNSIYAITSATDLSALKEDYENFVKYCSYLEQIKNISIPKEEAITLLFHACHILPIYIERQKKSSHYFLNAQKVEAILNDFLDFMKPALTLYLLQSGNTGYIKGFINEFLDFSYAS